MTRELRISRREFGWTASTATVAHDQLVSARRGMVRILGSLSAERAFSRGRQPPNGESRKRSHPASAQASRLGSLALVLSCSPVCWCECDWLAMAESAIDQEFHHSPPSVTYMCSDACAGCHTSISEVSGNTSRPGKSARSCVEQSCDHVGGAVR
jgi:hypothetical protein